MSKPIRVMVVDDSALYRRAICDVLSQHERVEVVAAAPNGKVALEKIPECAPDLITLDMEMPEMDGLTTLRALKIRHKSIKTIVFSHHTEKGAELTLQALNLGAVDFVTKPAAGGSLESNLEQIRKELLPEILELAKPRAEAASVLRPGPARAAVEKTSRDVIAIGVSTGGPTSLTRLFEQMPANLRQAILIVQHMPPIFTRKLADQLSRVGSVPAREACDGEIIQGGRAYIAPGDYHMEVANQGGVKRIRTHKGPQENFCRPAVDVLFRSVAKVYGKKALAVVMTGMGRDGFKGSELLHATGAPVIAQDEATSVVWGMPRTVVENGLADRVAPLGKMYQAIHSFAI